jgi:chemotaxis signal transduction protein
MSTAPTIQTETFLPYMRDVGNTVQTLQELNLMWRLIDASARMNCPGEAKTILSSLAATRTGFSALEDALIKTLVQEKVANVQKAIGTKAHYVIDIIVRNLFERTADVGFLATDEALCSYVAGLQTDRQAIEARLRAYRDKYTVYDDILLLDPQGQVLAQIDAAHPVACTHDPLVAATLGSHTFVETFRATDLRPARTRALVYSRRMHHPQTGSVIGVLCLCFNFEEEMAGIFHSHRDVDNHSVMLLLDDHDQVVASSEPRWIATGSLVPSNRSGAATLMPFCGRHYLVHTVPSPGYQGYPGPAGWQGQVMIPAEIAFNGGATDVLGALDADTAAGLLSHAQAFCPPLHEIMKAVTAASDTIQRIVWNGQLLTAGEAGEMQKLKSILDQISETGARSNALFARSINDLYQTVLASSMREAAFTAHLLVDLLDRNLYERSDDCRWWALTAELRTALSVDAPDAATLEKVNAVLATINGLYTVYTRIFLYDRNGVIIASTGETEDSGILGAQIDADCLAHVMRLRDPQQYHVSPFAETRLYDGNRTYIYHAALRSPDNDSVIVGGIGIVFDSAPEFRNMLAGGVGGRHAMHAFYVDRNGRILSGTDPKRAVGSLLPIAPTLLRLENGESTATIAIHEDQYAIVACSVSSGYREFKVSDGYEEDVIAVVIESFGPVRDSGASGAPYPLAMRADVAPEHGTDHATFFVGGNLVALPAAQVRQALPLSVMLPTSIGLRCERIGLIDLNRGAGRRDVIWVFDLAVLMGASRTQPAAGSQVIVLDYKGQTVGLRVDALHAVPRFSPAQVIQMPFTEMGASVLVTQVIKADDGARLIQLLDLERLFAVLNQEPVPALESAMLQMLDAA